MQLIRSFALVLGTASALQLPSAGVASRSAAASSTGPIARRQALATIGSAMAALATATGASAYDAIPEVQTDFAASERLRKERADLDAKRTKKLLEKLAPLEASTNEADFITAADELALYVIGEGSVPEGIKVKEFVKRITGALEALPQKKYSCEATRTNNGICYTPGKGATAAYDSLIKQLRKYSMIQLGDYRKVEFKAF